MPILNEKNLKGRVFKSRLNSQGMLISTGRVIVGAHKKLNENNALASFPLGSQWKNVEAISVNGKSEDSFTAKHIGVAEGLESMEAISLAKKHGLKHLVNTSKADYQRELNVAAHMIEKSDELFKYPVASVFTPEAVDERNEDKFKFVEYEFSKSTEKYNALILLEVELEKISSNESLITNIRTIADELFTNAVYNAPNKAKGKIDHRNQGAQMDAGKSAKIFLAKDEKMLLIGCIDPYGSLHPGDLITRIDNCYSNGVAQSMSMSEMGGAGIGAYMAFDLSTSFYVGVNPGVASIVMCAIPLHVSNRKIQKMPKNYHFLRVGSE